MYQSENRRSNLNEYYRYKAFGALWNEHPDGQETGKVAFAYLIHPVTEKLKSTILTEVADRGG